MIQEQATSESGPIIPQRDIQTPDTHGCLQGQIVHRLYDQKVDASALFDFYNFATEFPHGLRPVEG